MRYISVLMLLLSLACFSGCEKKAVGDVTIPSPEGIVFSPVKPYQEALPGAIVAFKVHVNAPLPVISVGVRFMFPGTNDYVALPQYPDMTETSLFTTGDGEFEYALPPSAVAVDADMKFKFIGVTANKTYEKEYTVRMKSIGLQAVRLYKPSGSVFKFSAFDLLGSAGVAQSAPVLTKDLVSYITTITYQGQDYSLTTGFYSENGTTFKFASAAQYNAAATTYLSAYNSIAAANEFTTLSVKADVLIPGVGALKPATYYIARVNRNGAFSYVGIKVIKVPVASLDTSESEPIQSPENDVVDLEIKK
jgi:hypothetical protein